MARFLITGGAGFIGSNLVHALLKRGDQVRVIDDFSTGRRENIQSVLSQIEVVEGSICDRDLVGKAMTGVEFCLHQAAIPSVSRSVESPWESNRANVEGAINVFLAARDAGVRRVVFASSSSVYGNASTMPVNESLPRAPISPYGVSKAACEMYGEVFSALYGIDIVGLRYFNVFGPRQDPKSQYAAVIPIFISRMLAGEAPPVDGDGLQSRDFTFVGNVVSANLKACHADGRLAGVYNVACGASTSILDMVAILNDVLGSQLDPVFRPARPGDIRNSWADISRAKTAFGYEPLTSIRDGLLETARWFWDVLPRG